MVTIRKQYLETRQVSPLLLVAALRCQLRPLFPFATPIGGRPESRGAAESDPWICRFRSPRPGWHHQRRHLCAAGAGAGAGVRGHPGDLHSAGRVRRLRRADAGDDAGGQGAGHGLAAAGARDGDRPVLDGISRCCARGAPQVAALADLNVGYPLALRRRSVRLPPLPSCRWRCRSLLDAARGAAGADDVPPRLPADGRGASVLVLLIVSVAVHVAMVGLGLLFFGAEGSRTPAFTDISFELAGCGLRADDLGRRGVGAADRRALRCSSTHDLRQGAARHRDEPHRRPPDGDSAGSPASSPSRRRSSGAFSGMLIAPITTIYYDSGFLIGLKGFVGAIIGGLASIRSPPSAPCWSACSSPSRRSGPAPSRK
jgi:hypothetical protein